MAALLALVASLALAPMMLAGCSTSADGSSDASADASAEASQANISVQLKIDSSAADNSVGFVGSVSVPEGSTVLDALEAADMDAVVQDSQYGKYVDSIGGLATGDHGSASGWVFTVNGESIMESADSCVLSDGDEVVWSYMV